MIRATSPIPPTLPQPRKCPACGGTIYGIICNYCKRPLTTHYKDHK